MTTDAPGPEEEPDDDAEALKWAGDDARGQVAPRLRARSDAAAVAAASPEPHPDGPDAADADRHIALRVGTVLFAAGYVAATIGWILSVQQIASPFPDLLGDIMWQFGEFLAMVAPLLWFGAVLTLTGPGARHRGATRVGWLAAGLIVLVPWPFLFGVLL